MTVLATKETRDLIGINSFERAIVWSACSLLSAINQQSSTYNNNFTIFADQESSQILITFGMPLDMPKFWASMGDPDYLKNITDLTVTYEGEYLSITNSLELEPPSINTLEKYFIWSCKKLREFYLQNLPTKANRINLSTDLRRSAMFVTVNLDYVPLIYSQSDSLLKAVIVESSNNESPSSLFGNSLVGNNFLVGN